MRIYEHGLEKFNKDFDMRALIMHQRDVRYMKEWVNKLRMKHFPKAKMREFEMGPDKRLHPISFIE